MTQETSDDIQKRLELLTRRDEVLNYFRSLTKLTEFVGAELANANANLARIDERIKLNDIALKAKLEEE